MEVIAFLATVLLPMAFPWWYAISYANGVPNGTTTQVMSALTALTPILLAVFHLKQWTFEENNERKPRFRLVLFLWYVFAWLQANAGSTPSNFNAYTTPAILAWYLYLTCAVAATLWFIWANLNEDYRPTWASVSAFFVRYWKIIAAVTGFIVWFALTQIIGPRPVILGTIVAGILALIVFLYTHTGKSN